MRDEQFLCLVVWQPGKCVILNQYRRSAEHWWKGGRQREVEAGGSGAVVEREGAPVCSEEESSSFRLSCSAEGTRRRITGSDYIVDYIVNQRVGCGGQKHLIRE